MTRVRFYGNVIPTSWYKHICTEAKKPHSVAITLLGEICWWYKDREVRDENGLPVGWERKFHGEALQMSPKQFAAKFGFSTKTCQRGLEHLEKMGLIRRSEETVNTRMGRLGNVCFIRVSPEKIEEITWADSQASEQPIPRTPLDGSVQSSGLGRPNITRTTRQKQKTPKSPKRGQKIFSGVVECEDQSPPLQSPEDCVDPDVSKTQPRCRDWMAEAKADPLSRQFLGLVGLDDFPAESRATFARSFVTRRQNGKLRDHDIQLLVCVAGELPRVSNALKWFEQYEEIIDLARDLLTAEQSTLQEICENLTASCEQQKLIFDNAQRFVSANPNPADLFGGEIYLTLPRWALLIAYQISSPSGVDAWKGEFRLKIIEEFYAEPAAFQFLHENGYDTQTLLGLDAEEVQPLLDSRRKDQQARLQELETCLDVCQPGGHDTGWA